MEGVSSKQSSPPYVLRAGQYSRLKSHLNSGVTDSSAYTSAFCNGWQLRGGKEIVSPVCCSHTMEQGFLFFLFIR